jgi:AraC-like DNA-binding protein
MGKDYPISLRIVMAAQAKNMAFRANLNDAFPMVILNSKGRLSLAQIRAVLATAKSAGVNVDAVALRLGLNPEAMGNPDTRVPLDLMRQLWSELLAETGSADVALRISATLHPSMYGLAGSLIMSSGTVGEAVTLLQRYFRLLADDGLFELQTQPASTWILLTLAPIEDKEVWRCAVEWSLGGLLASLRSLTREPLVPLRVSFSYPLPACEQSYREVFQCPLEFNAARTGIHLRSKDLNLPVLTANRSLQPLLLSKAEDDIRLLDEHASVADLVKALLRSSPLGQSPDVARISARLALSGRTLARRLAAEGTSFQALQDEYRRDTCCRLLAQPGYSIEEIAFLAGYSELSTYHRAFKRWTEQTPAEYRKKLVQR